MSRSKVEAEESLWEALAAVHLDSWKQNEANQAITEGVPEARRALQSTSRLAESAAQAILIAKAFKCTGADANASLQAAARLVAAEMSVPFEPEVFPETDLDRVVDAIESVAGAIAGAL